MELKSTRKNFPSLYFIRPLEIEQRFSSMADILEWIDEDCERSDGTEFLMTMTEIEGKCVNDKNYKLLFSC